MEGPSSKQANVYTNDQGTHSMDTFNHPAPPPAYEANSYPQPGSSNPQPSSGPAPTVLQHPPVTVTQNYPPRTVINPQNTGVTVTQYPGVTVTQQPGVTTFQPGAPGNRAVFLQPLLLPREPIMMQCPSCAHQMQTRVEYQAAARTHICALLLCLTMLWPCACLPYCMNDCLTAQHYCSNCGAFVGVRY
ncbi:LITAF-like zinc ribbon domain-containing protein [Phthorimaea operculella]|nr:LITAF-like zinc ribbon domain-containing protein [Phthorimaea operculella]